MDDVDAINLMLAVLRIAVGAMIIAHGYNHIFGGGRIEGTAGWFASMGLRPGIVHAWMASVTELGAGVLLILGLLTPLGAAGVVGVMVVAWITAHRTNGFFIFKPGQGWEYVMIVTVVGLTIATIGPGDWSLDNALDLTEDLTGTTGLVLGLLGVVGAAGLLAAFWRPGRTD
ncbi:MAG: DoxX family protein [Acidimicrobiales bacterium]|nr:DoxX family protein [Acidimicrobiales bacterium]